MMGKFKVRTDLALEARESYGEEDIRIRGVHVEEHTDKEREIHTTRVVIETENGAKAMGKPVGTYITIEAPNMSVPDEGYHREISGEVAKHLRELIEKAEETEKKEKRNTEDDGQNRKQSTEEDLKKRVKNAEDDRESEKRDGEDSFRKEKNGDGGLSVLIVGLGNREVTPDALGPNVVGNLHITRHMIREYGRIGSGFETVDEISAIAPGVMAQTGMETLEIIKGVVETTKPDVVIAIDALAARSTRRLNRTIQITDTGINPGSGVGNHRNAINEETLGVPVIAVGVPTVVDAATIVNDTMEDLIEEMDRTVQMQKLGGTLGTLNQAEKHQMIRELISPHLNTMFVTPKDIDETVKYLSYTISEGLNMAFAGKE